MANDDKPKKNYTNRTRQIEYKIRLTEEEFQYLQMQKLNSVILPEVRFLKSAELYSSLQTDVSNQILNHHSLVKQQ